MEKQLNTYQHWADIHLSKEDAEKFFVNMANEQNPLDPSTQTVEDEFLYSAFIWDRSNEGLDYWMRVQKNIEEKNGWQS